MMEWLDLLLMSSTSMPPWAKTVDAARVTMAEKVLSFMLLMVDLVDGRQVRTK